MTRKPGRLPRLYSNYRRLRDDFEAEVLSGMPDLDHVTKLIMEMATVRKSVQAYLRANA